jgi:glycosyltransferase involved in cell wall biosynthesis
MRSFVVCKKNKEKMNPRLSIILPCYNVEHYIAQCLQSIYNQDIPESEYEVICVNDCSPDNTRGIILEFQKKHSNLILIDHETNKMLGATRNTGLRAAQGKYVWFVDSDDFIAENCLQKLLEIADNDDLEILQFNSRRITNAGECSDYNPFDKNTEVITGIDFLNDKTQSYKEKSVTAWCKIFDRNFLICNNLYYQQTYWEDNFHTLKSLLLAMRFRYINEYIYFYRQHETAMSNSFSLRPGDKQLSGKEIAGHVIAGLDCLDLLKNAPENLITNDIADRYKSWDINPYFSSRILFYLAWKDRMDYYRLSKKFNRKTATPFFSLTYGFLLKYPILIFPLHIAKWARIIYNFTFSH